MLVFSNHKKIELVVVTIWFVSSINNIKQISCQSAKVAVCQVVKMRQLTKVSKRKNKKVYLVLL